MSGGAFPSHHQIKPAPGIHWSIFGLRPPFVHLVVGFGDPSAQCRAGGLDRAPPWRVGRPPPQGPSLWSELCCLGPSSLTRPHPPHPRAHRDFTAWRLIRDAFAVRERLGDPRAVPGFRCTFPPGMPSSTTPGNPIIDSSRATMSAWPSPRVDRLGTPKAPAIRFTRAMTFGATWFTHLLRPARLLAPQYGFDHLRGQRGLLLPGFQLVRPVAGYDCSSDWNSLGWRDSPP